MHGLGVAVLASGGHGGHGGHGMLLIVVLLVIIAVIVGGWMFYAARVRAGRGKKS